MADQPESSDRLFEIEARVHRRDDRALARGARFLRRHDVSARLADVFQRGTAESYGSALADDPVLQAMQDAVNP